MLLFEATAYSNDTKQRQITIDLDKKAESRTITLKVNHETFWKIICESGNLNFQLLLSSHSTNYACLALCGVTAAVAIIDCYWKYGYSGNWNDFDKCLNDKSITVGTTVLTCIIKCFP